MVKDCVKQESIRYMQGMTFDLARRCYTSKQTESDHVFQWLSARDRLTLWSYLEVPEADRMPGREVIRVREQSEICYCYGLSQEEDPMSKYLKMAGGM